MTDEEMAVQYADNYNLMNKDLSPKSPRHIVIEAFLAGLKTQIEKMRCCQNCKNEGEDYYGNSCCRINESFWNCDKWEIKK
jgi:hypothetical protein